MGCWKNTRRIRKLLACGSWFANSSRVLPTSRVVHQPINHRNLWSIANRCVCSCVYSPALILECHVQGAVPETTSKCFCLSLWHEEFENWAVCYNTSPPYRQQVCSCSVHRQMFLIFRHSWPIPRDVEKDDKNASKPVARHFNLPNHSKQHMVVCGLSLHQGSTESRKTLEQKFIFQIGTLNPHGINERFSFN